MQCVDSVMILIQTEFMEGPVAWLDLWSLTKLVEASRSALLVFVQAVDGMAAHERHLDSLLVANELRA